MPPPSLFRLAKSPVQIGLRAPLPEIAQPPSLTLIMVQVPLLKEDSTQVDMSINCLGLASSF